MYIRHYCHSWGDVASITSAQWLLSFYPKSIDLNYMFHGYNLTQKRQEWGSFVAALHASRHEGQTVVLTCYCIVYLYIALCYRLHEVSVITGLIQNTIIYVTLAGSGGVIRL